jgi:glycosyltransferase involved in cell wall biosynthesis
MKIGFFTSKYPYRSITPPAHYFIGGSGLACHEVCEALAARGHDVHVFTTAFSSAPHTEQYDNLIVHRYGSQLHLATINVSTGIFTKPKHVPVDVTVLNFDEPPLPIAGYLYARQTEVPLIVYYHGDWDASYGSVVRRLGVATCIRYVDNILRRADAIVAVSRHYADQSPFLRTYRDKTVVIPNGIRADAFTCDASADAWRARLDIPDDAPLALFLSNLYQNKAPDELIRAFPEVLRSVPSAFLVIAGEGPLKPGLEQLAARLEISDRLRFVGALRGAERVRCYCAADLFVLPSHKEALSTVALESLLCCTPIVITDGNGCVDIVQKARCGYIMRQGNVRELSTVIAHALNNPVELREMAERGNRYVREYVTWENFTSEFEGLIGRVLDRSGYQDKAQTRTSQNVKK